MAKQFYINDHGPTEIVNGKFYCSVLKLWCVMVGEYAEVDPNKEDISKLMGSPKCHRRIAFLYFDYDLYNFNFDEYEIDHVNENKLDNRSHNLNPLLREEHRIKGRFIYDCHGCDRKIRFEHLPLCIGCQMKHFVKNPVISI